MRASRQIALCILLCAVVLAGAPGRLQAAEKSDKIDSLVFARLKELGIEPSDRCSDAVFVRRVYLDVTGTLPTGGEAIDFLRSRKPDKRAALIDKLLASDSYADYWAMKWCDILRVKSEFPSKLWPNAVQAYYRWIHDALKKNMPYDEFARSLLTSSGSNFRVAPVNFYRAVPKKSPDGLATIVALTFMGARTKHWTDDQRSGMAAFFCQVGYKGTSEWKEEIVYHDRLAPFTDPETKKPCVPVFPDGTAATIPEGSDPREAFADWLISPENPWFTVNIVNRAWYWLMGRGLVHEPDDIRPDNAPQNEKLLKFLARELAAGKYDLKHIFRLILNSDTYQLSSITTDSNKEDVANFSHYYVRQLEAEVLMDAICRLTGTREQYSSRVPEPFTFVPPEAPSVTLSDGSISSPFLEMFGRPPRDTGLESERSNTPSARQRLHMLNSTHIHQKILSSGKIRALARYTKDEAAFVGRLYLAVLSRHPTKDEVRIARQYVATDGLNRRDATVDLVWALMNTKEFLCRH